MEVVLVAFTTLVLMPIHSVRMSIGADFQELAVQKKVGAKFKQNHTSMDSIQEAVKFMQPENHMANCVNETSVTLLAHAPPTLKLSPLSLFKTLSGTLDLNIPGLPKGDRCCLPASILSDGKYKASQFDARMANITTINASLQKQITIGNSAFGELRTARKLDVIRDWKTFLSPFEAAAHEIWVLTSTLECERYDLKQIWLRSYNKWKRWNPFSRAGKDAKRIKKDILDPLKATILLAWKWRAIRGYEFMSNLNSGRSLIEVFAKREKGTSLAYSAKTGQIHQRSKGLGLCAASAYNPASGEVAFFQSSREERGIAAVWNPAIQQIEMREAQSNNSISGCFDRDGLKVEFREGSSCVWNPQVRRVMWYENPIGGVGVAAWNASSGQVVLYNISGDYDRDGGSISVYYQTPEDPLGDFQTATSCRITRRRRSRRRRSRRRRSRRRRSRRRDIR